MAIDPSIPLSYRGGQIDLMGPMTQAMNLRQLIRQGKAQDRQMEADQAMRDDLAEYQSDPSKPMTLKRLTQFDPLKAAEVKKTFVESAMAQQKAKLEQSRQQLQFGAQVLNSVKDAGTYNRAVTTLKNKGMDVSEFPPQYDPQFVQAQIQQGMTLSEQLDQHWKKQGFDQEERKIAATAEAKKNDKSVIKSQKEFSSRLGSILAEAEKLKTMVQDKGTFELIGSQNKILDQKITALATDAAKLFDPESVARESEVASFKSMLFEPGTLGMRNQTAMDTVEGFKQMMVERAQREADIQGMPGFSKQIGQIVSGAQKPGGAGDAGNTVVSDDEHRSALTWAMQYPSDPRSKRILELNGKKQAGR